MKYGIREAVDVVFRAKSSVSIGGVSFAAGEPVIYFDSVKTSTTEGTATTVYAQGGKGNSRLIAWEGDKTITFTFEEALISTEGLSILTGAGVLASGGGTPVHLHQKVIIPSVTVGALGIVTADLTAAIGTLGTLAATTIYGFAVDSNGEVTTRLGAATAAAGDALTWATTTLAPASVTDILVDYYIVAAAGTKEITITAAQFAGYYYIEGDTLFRRQRDGADLAAQLVIPNAKIQSGFTFTMSSSGDPSTFTFTADCMPGTVLGSGAKKVLYALQVKE